MNIICRRVFFNRNSFYNSILRNPGVKSIIASTNLTLIKSNFSSHLTSQKVLQENTNIVKDVILFKYDNPRFYKVVNIFAIVQYFFWVYLGYISQTTLRDVPVDESKISSTDPFYKKINLGEKKYRYMMSISCVTLGFAILSGTWLFTMRSVRYLILHKGGQVVTLVTYNPMGRNRMMDVPLSNVSCQQTRGGSQSTLALKVKNRRFHYMLDMRGEFRNTKLFDSTAGLYRGF